MVNHTDLDFHIHCHHNSFCNLYTRKEKNESGTVIYVYVLWIDSLEDNEIVEHDMFTLNRPTGQRCWSFLEGNATHTHTHTMEHDGVQTHRFKFTLSLMLAMFWIK